MPPPTPILRPHLPALLVLLFATVCGTLPGGAVGWRVATAHALLLAAAVWGAGWRRPLGLGPAGGWLLAALALAIALSLVLSPVPRAGLAAAVLSPAFLLLPSVVERAWSSPGARRAGGLSLALALLAVAVVALDGWLRRDTPGTSLPLGHHNLLAAWLVGLLPMATWAALGSFETPARRAHRWLAGAALAAGLLALLATRSLAGGVALAAVLLVAAAGSKNRLAPRGSGNRLAPWSSGNRLAPPGNRLAPPGNRLALGGGLGLAALVLVLQGPRLLGLLSGADSSLAARRVYLAAGWEGLWQRPVVGWGPGAAAWTLAEHLPPAPGVLPASQVVADLHCLPLHLAYELGLGGWLLAAGVAAVFVVARRRDRVEDPGLRRAALLGLLGLAVASLGGLPLAVTALPVAAAVLAGAALAARGEPPARVSRWPAALYAAGAAAVLIPLDFAHLAYDRAAGAPSPGVSMAHLSAAVEADPAFPLYAARLAWLESAAGDAGAGTRALEAARDARGIAAFWLAAGRLADAGGSEETAREAYLEACRLDPLGAFAPFFLAVSAEGDARAAGWGARALAAEPRLLAAAGWRRAGALRRRSVTLAAACEPLDAGWRRSLAVTAGRLQDLGRDGGAQRRLALVMDGEAAASLSLHAFRRRPWPAYVAEVALDAGALEQVTLPPAFAYRELEAGALDRRRCLLASGR